MKGSSFTPQQRRIILYLILIVVVVFGLLAGFLVTSLQSLEPAPVVTPSPPPPTTPPPTTSSPTPTETPVPREGFWPQVRAARLFDQIAHQVETRRALVPQAEVPLSFLSEHQMEEILRSYHADDDPQSRLLPYSILGLLPDELGVVQAQTPAGVYLSEQKQLYVAIDRSEDDPDTQALLAHAYVHALQDQHFDLEGLRARAQTTDEKLALEALIEGDATLVTGLYRSEDLSSVDWDQLTDLIVEAEQPRYGGALADDETWNELRRFPSREGRKFVAAVVEHEGWDSLNRSYTNPPLSTEQILHPSRYLGDSPRGEPDQPSAVHVPDLAPVLGSEWQPILEDTLGEFAVGLYLSQAMPQEAAWRRADGWDGDTLRVWERENGRRVVVWRTMWDTASEAQEFERGITLLIPQHYVPVRPFDAPRALLGQWWETPSGTVHARRDGRYLLFVRAPDTNTVVNALGRLP